jgi:hypothetical protein
VLITAGDPEIPTAGTPKTIDEVEHTQSQRYLNLVSGRWASEE